MRPDAQQMGLPVNALRAELLEGAAEGKRTAMGNIPQLAEANNNVKNLKAKVEVLKAIQAKIQRPTGGRLQHKDAERHLPTELRKKVPEASRLRVRDDGLKGSTGPHVRLAMTSL